MPPPPKGLGAWHRIPVEKVKAVEQGLVRLVFAQLAHDHVPHLDGRTAGHDLVSQAHRIRDRGREGPSDALALAISIHALRKESDDLVGGGSGRDVISIHALRKESDLNESSNSVPQKISYAIYRI